MESPAEKAQQVTPRHFFPREKSAGAMGLGFWCLLLTMISTWLKTRLRVPDRTPAMVAVTWKVTCTGAGENL